MKTNSLLFTLFLGLLSLSFASPALANPSEGPIVYEGFLEDASGRAIGGIYPLSFSFYVSEKSQKPVWTSEMFVASDSGFYVVELGQNPPFPKNFDPKKSWLGVTLKGEKELLRVDLSKQLVASDGGQLDGAVPSQIRGKVSYADSSGTAYEAERAKTADTVGSLSEEDIKDLIARAEGQGGNAKVELGTVKRYSDTAGGSGGKPYSLECPAGHVVTGIRGMAGSMLDQISLICSPLK